MRTPENTRALREEALTVQIELEAGCYCASNPPHLRPCDNHRAAVMIARLREALYVQREEPERAAPEWAGYPLTWGDEG